MLASRVFFSFTEIPDPDHHRPYNEWHQLDHRPENLALPGVLYGERWVRSPDCAAVSSASDARFESFHYLNMYWLREPIAESRKAWQDLGSRAFQWGRRPDVSIARRNHLQFCDPIKGYVHPRVLVNEDILPIRPNLGVWLSVSRVVGSESTSDDLFCWYDPVRIPDTLGVGLVRSGLSPPGISPGSSRRGSLDTAQPDSVKPHPRR
jgi:hypothetical protein